MSNPSRRPRPRPSRKKPGGELARLLDDVERYLTRFVIFPAAESENPHTPHTPHTLSASKGSRFCAQSTVCALWIAHVHLIDAFRVSPRLLISSPESDCGKSTLADAVALLCPDAASVASMTAPALFRSIELGQFGVYVHDEIDQLYTSRLSERAIELTGIIDSGYKTNGHVLRCVGKLHTPTLFKTFAPLLLAGIDRGHFPEQVVSRSILIRLKPKLTSEEVEEFVPEDEFESVGSDAAKLREGFEQIATAALFDRLRVTRPAELGLHNRRRELASPLQRIGRLAGHEWSQRAAEALTELLAPQRETSVTIKLLADIKRAFDAARRDRLFSGELIEALTSDESSPWPRYSPGRNSPALTAPELAQMLRNYEISPAPIWLNGRSGRGYKRQQFVDAWQRCLPGLEPREGVRGVRSVRNSAGNDAQPSEKPRSRPRPVPRTKPEQSPADGTRSSEARATENGAANERSTTERVIEILGRDPSANPFLPPRKEQS